MCHVIAKAELAKADLAGWTSIVFINLDRSGKRKNIIELAMHKLHKRAD